MYVKVMWWCSIKDNICSVSQLSVMCDGFLGLWNLFCAMEYVKFIQDLCNSHSTRFPWGSQTILTVISKNTKQVVLQ